MPEEPSDMLLPDHQMADGLGIGAGLPSDIAQSEEEELRLRKNKGNNDDEVIQREQYEVASYDNLSQLLVAKKDDLQREKGHTQ